MHDDVIAPPTTTARTAPWARRRHVLVPLFCLI